MKLSVLMITFNHDKYIAQALDSVLMQELPFEYEIVIGDDFSTDETREIILEYAARYPGKIKPLLHEHNLGLLGKNNLLKTLSACTGEYIALLEGDDYWKSSDKLQKQVDYLDSHPEYAACFHNVIVEYENEPEKNHLFHNNQMKSVFTLLDIVSGFFIPTCSTMFRARLFGEFPSWYFKMPMGDWPLHVLNAQHGDYGYIDEVLGSYRVHDGGIWSSQKRVDILSKTIAAVKIIDEYLDYKFHNKLQTNISSWYYEMADCYFHDNLVFAPYKYLFKSLTAMPSIDKSFVNQATNLFTKIFLKQIGLRK